MPVTASTTDTPSTKPPFADVLVKHSIPLSATSDMPVIDLTKPNAIEQAEKAEVDTEAKPQDTGETSGEKPEGEADAQPTKQEGGEEGDKTSPQQRAAFARERNRRQAAEQRATSLETQVAQLAQAVAKLTGEADRPKDDPRPDRDAFDTPAAYDTALEDWAGRRATEVAVTEAKAQQVRELQARQVKAQLDTYNERKSAFEADHADFDDVVMTDDLQISPAMSQAILEAEDGPAIAYYLGQNPEMAERISKLSPTQAVRELGRISAKLENPPKPKPDPIRPLASRNSGGEKSPDDMSMDEYAAYRKAKAN